MKKVLYMFSELLDEDIDWLGAIGTTHKISRNETLIVEGSIVPALYIVIEGQFTVTNRFLSSSVGDFTLTSGDIVGEMSFVDGRPSSASVSANSDCKVLAISHDSIGRRIEEKADFGVRFYKSIALFLSLRMRSTTGGMMISSTQTLEAHDPDELDENLLESSTLAALRYERLCASLS